MTDRGENGPPIKVVL